MRKTIFILAVLALAAGGVAIFQSGLMKLGGQLLTRIGASGTQLQQVLAGSTDFLGMNSSQAATSTKPYDLYVPGLRSGDLVFAQLSTTTPNAGQLSAGWFIRSCHASTTPNYATCDVSNLTGTAAVPSIGDVGSSTRFLGIRLD